MLFGFFLFYYRLKQYMQLELVTKQVKRRYNIFILYYRFKSIILDKLVAFTAISFHFCSNVLLTLLFKTYKLLSRDTQPEYHLVRFWCVLGDTVIMKINQPTKNKSTQYTYALTRVTTFTCGRQVSRRSALNHKSAFILNCNSYGTFLHNVNNFIHTLESLLFKKRY